MPNKLVYGFRAIDEVGTITNRFGNKALIVSDPVMEKEGLVNRVENLLKKAGVSVSKYTDILTEPTTRNLKDVLTLMSDGNYDFILALGGGSCIDTAKAANVMYVNEGEIADYIPGMKHFTKKGLPLIAIPTTAGTGSEVTKVTVITDANTQVKMMVSQPELLPDVAIVDPELTYTCPQKVTAATGLDTLCHAIEAYLSDRSHELTDHYALTAIEYVFRFLPRAYQDRNDKEAREKMSIAATMASIAFSNASVTLIHGMSRPIGALFHIPHGISNAMILPAVLEFTKDGCTEKLTNIYRSLHPSNSNVEASDLVERFIKDLKHLCIEVNTPNLQQWGVNGQLYEQHLQKMAKDALASGSPNNHPEKLGLEEIVELYNLCYSYQF
ncbi:iron-containing alcohol dehydrogenase [Virgibacillus byunsanensis]